MFNLFKRPKPTRTVALQYRTYWSQEKYASYYEFHFDVTSTEWPDQPTYDITRYINQWKLMERLLCAKFPGFTFEGSHGYNIDDNTTPKQAVKILERLAKNIKRMSDQELNKHSRSTGSGSFEVRLP